MKIVSIVGARPNFMKIAPIARAIKEHKSIEHVLVHTGQHYDYQMSESFFDQLGIPKPDVNLEIGSSSHAIQTARIMLAFEKVVLKYLPDVVLVVGDVNSTLACSIVASKLGIAVAHVEAGLRSYDRQMPEEINRVVTDSITDIFFTTSKSADENLIHEGVAKNRIFFVGNVMIDTLFHNIQPARELDILDRLNVKKNQYALVTLHRPSNVDHKEALNRIIQAFESIEKHVPIIFPVHPRTKANIEKFISKARLAKMKNVQLISPLSYFEFLNAMMYAKLVLTDSGGIQEETTVLGVPCLTIRENTERPITIDVGTNVLVGTNTQRIIDESMRVINGKQKKGQRPQYWDGKSSQRIVKKLLELHQKKRLLRCA